MLLRSDTLHSLHCACSQMDDQPQSCPTAGPSMIKECTAFCTYMTGMKQECAISRRKSCISWTPVRCVWSPAKTWPWRKWSCQQSQDPNLVQADDRRIAEAHYKMALTLQFLEDPERALEHANKAMVVCKARIARLSAAPLGADAAVEDPADGVSPRGECDAVPVWAPWTSR